MNTRRLLSAFLRWVGGRQTIADRAPDSFELALNCERFFLHCDELYSQVFPVVAVECGARQVDFAEHARNMRQVRRDEGVARGTFLLDGRSRYKWRDG